MTRSEPAPAKKPMLSEDWIATLIGLAIVLIIGVGLIGPGPQTVTLEADAGSTDESEARAMDGWAVTATLDGEKVTIETPFESLDAGKTYTYRCEKGQIIATGSVDNPDLDDNQALLILDNQCEASVALTAKTESAIPWPLFQ